jgi:hypothetical protein
VARLKWEVNNMPDTVKDNRAGRKHLFDSFFQSDAILFCIL